MLNSALLQRDTARGGKAVYTAKEQADSVLKQHQDERQKRKKGFWSWSLPDSHLRAMTVGHLLHITVARVPSCVQGLHTKV